MTEPKRKCEICGYEDDLSNLPEGICQDCGDSYTTMKISKLTKHSLNSHGKKGQTYNEIIREVIRENASLGKINDSLQDKNLADFLIRIKEIKGRDNEVAPEYFGKLFFDIALLTSIDVGDLKRYFKYAFDDFNNRLKEKKGGKNGTKTRIHKV